MERKTLIRIEAASNPRTSELGRPFVYQPVSIKLLTLLFGALGILLASWLYTAKLNSTVPVRGSVISEEGLIKVYARRRGVYAEIKVHEGQQVKQGDVVAIIGDQALDEREDSSPPIDSLIVERIKMRQAAELSRAVHSSAIDELNESYQSAVTDLGLLEEAAGYEEQLLDIDQQDLKTDEESFRRQAIPIEKLLSKRSAVLERKRRGTEIRREREQLLSRIDGHQRALIQETLRFKDRQSNLDTKLDSLDKTIAMREFRNAPKTVVAPISGTVSVVRAHPLDPVTDSPLLDILPSQAIFEAELYVGQHAIGGVKIGEEVLIEFDAFKVQSYGNYKAKISSVSASPVDPREHLLPVMEVDGPVYLVHAALDRQSVGSEGDPIPLRTGMQFTAEMINDSRSILSTVLSPITNVQKRL